MPLNSKIIRDNFEAATRYMHEQYDYAREKHAELREKMKEDPQVRVAVYHGFTYAACLLGPLAVGMYLNITREGSWDPRNIFGPPNNVQKIDMSAPDEAPLNLNRYEP